MSSEGDKLDQVYEELVEKFPGYLGAHVAYLNALDAPSDAKKYASHYSLISQSLVVVSLMIPFLFGPSILGLPHP